MGTDRPKRIAAFSILPPDKPFRIDWFGNVIYSRDIRHSQPFIAVAISEVPDVEWQHSTAFNGTLHQRHVWVPVGLLPLLRIGDIWMNGTLAGSPSYAVEECMITVNRETSSLIKTGVSDDRSGFILPFQAHPYHKEHTHSYCVRVSLGEDAWLIIPAFELIRFYFGSSSNLVARLFLVPFRKDKFWIAVDKDEHGVAHIELADGISGYSAADVGRIALNTAAQRAARVVGESCMASSARGDRAYPKAVFPFAGETTLKVSGMWLQTGAATRAFLAFRLLSCSHAFPFASVRYTMTRKPVVASASPGDGVKQNSGNEQGRQRFQGKKEADKTLDNREPSGRLSEKKVAIGELARFPDLASKPVIRVDPDVPVTVVHTGEQARVDSWSVGEGGTQEDIRPIDLVDTRQAPEPKSHPLSGTTYWKMLLELVDELVRLFPTVEYVPLDQRQRHPHFSVMPRLVNADGEIHPLCFIEDHGEIRARYVSVLHVADSESTFFVVCPEPMEQNGSCMEPLILLVFGTGTGCFFDSRALLETLSRAVWGEDTLAARVQRIVPEDDVGRRKSVRSAIRSAVANVGVGDAAAS